MCSKHKNPLSLLPDCHPHLQMHARKQLTLSTTQDKHLVPRTYTARHKKYECYMLAHELPSSPGSHFAIVDSGTPVHIVFDHMFVTNTREDHTSVSGFSGNLSRATHRGDLSARVLNQNKEYISIHDSDSTLVVPDCIRRLYSVRQATHKGYQVQLDCSNPGIWACLNYIPFVTDPDTSLWLLPLFPPTSADNGLYPLPAFPATVDTPDIAERRQEWMIEHHRLGHPSQKRQASLDIEGLTHPKVPKLNCPTCFLSFP